MRFRFAISALLVFLCCRMASAAPPSIPGEYKGEWQYTLASGSKGYAVALLPKNAPPVADWKAAPTRGELLVRFDADDPPTKNIFNAERNIYERPQREIAIYWDGVEVARRLSPGPLDGGPGATTRFQVAFVTGGAEVTVSAGTTTTYDHYFVPGVMPFVARLDVSDPAAISHVALMGTQHARLNPQPIHVRAIDTMLISNGKPGGTSWADFPTDTERIGRVVCTLTLAKTANGIDPWDRIGNVYEWQQNVTDLLPLLTGKRKVQIDCTTYSQGWLASVDFAFYPGPAARHPYKVVNLWNTVALIGQESKPFASFVPPMTVPIDPKADAAAVRMLVTGHGEDPNTDNAAEFISLWRKLSVGGATYQNTLWKEDNYLNPCRPQGGTWKFDRAGWGPGTVVDPWVVDVTKDVKAGTNATFDYTIQPYVNKTPNNGDPARYVVGAQLILYRRG